MHIEIEPLKKIVIDGISVCLGMERSRVEALLGKGEPVAERCYYYGGELSVSYDRFGNVEFMEFLGGTDGNLKPYVYGISAFDGEAGEVSVLLQRHNGGEISDDEGGHCHTFRNLSLGLYRESTPESVSEMVEEAKKLGEPMGPEDIAYEWKRANHWATIGIGVPGYYQP